MEEGWLLLGDPVPDGVPDDRRGPGGSLLLSHFVSRCRVGREIVRVVVCHPSIAIMHLTCNEDQVGLTPTGGSITSDVVREERLYMTSSS